MWDAIAGIGGGILKDFALTKYGQDFNADEAAKARRFSERMARSRYQFAVEDMRAAGLNPMLAASGGFSPGTAGSFSASAGVSNSTDVAGAYNATRRTTQDIEKSRQDVKQSQSTTDLIGEQIKTQKATQRNLEASSAKALAEETLALQQAYKTIVDADYSAERTITERTLQKLNQANAASKSQQVIRNAPLTNLIEGSNISTTARDVGQKASEVLDFSIFDRLRDAAIKRRQKAEKAGKVHNYKLFK